MYNYKNIDLRCDDNGEMVTFTKHTWEDEEDYEITIADAYCGGDYMGIKGRFKRAWKAFWARPICYTGVLCKDKERMKKFLNDCLEVMEDQNSK